MSDNQDEPKRGDSEVDAKVGDSQMDSKGGYDQADAAGYPEDPFSQRKTTSHDLKTRVPVITEIADIRDEEFNSQTYKTCENVGKAVIVSNFMDGYTRKNNRDLATRLYAKGDCEKLEVALRRIGFQPLDKDQDSMVYKNLTKSQFVALYSKVAKEINYRPKQGEGYTCVLFFVMSYGRSGLIRCHAEPGEKGEHPFVEQKHLQEAFQPQNNHSLALKPKLFIIHTIPEATSEADAAGGIEVTTTKRIPREADFLTYACDQYCIKGEDDNIFINSVVHVLNNLAKEKEERKPAMEIQKVLIRMNKEYKDKRLYNTWKLPCVTSSLTKQLILF